MGLPLILFHFFAGLCRIPPRNWILQEGREHPHRLGVSIEKMIKECIAKGGIRSTWFVWRSPGREGVDGHSTVVVSIRRGLFSPVCGSEGPWIDDLYVEVWLPGTLHPIRDRNIRCPCLGAQVVNSPRFVPFCRAEMLSDDRWPEAHRQLLKRNCTKGDQQWYPVCCRTK